ncbi:MAG: helix-turn-helix transcriptional regulator, partial [Clostridia bacterium]|nr:helix-turn-helix transcriptional regulator [Clostridia bacterium]
MIDNKATGRMIAKLRQAKGLTQQQLAAIIGVSHQAVSKWESGAALPDIQTMVSLTRFFGISLEQLIYAEINEEENEEIPVEEKELKHMTVQQLLVMAPFMSKEAVEEIAMTIETPISANQLAKLAPHLRPEALEALIERHGISLTWESLKKIAPFMTRETVDDIARKIASGEKTIGHDSDRFDKAMNDIGKAFDNFGKGAGEVLDDVGKGVKKAVKKAVKFGEVVINDVSEAFAEMDKKDKAEDEQRSERRLAIRRKAFERALQDEKWDWIAAHIAEIEDDAELKA